VGFFIRGPDSGTLLFDSDIDKIERAIQKVIQEAREAAVIPLPSLSDFSSDEEMGELERVTLGDHGNLDNINEVTQGFQLVNPNLFVIKH